MDSKDRWRARSIPGDSGAGRLEMELGEGNGSEAAEQ